MEVNTDSALLGLPQEVQMLIFESVDHAPSQVALALSCKQMARVSSSINLSRTYVSAKYAGLLPKEVFDIPELMRQLVPWMPSHLRLCGHCLTNRPYDDKEYWNDVLPDLPSVASATRAQAIPMPGSRKADFWITKTGWTFKEASWHRQSHDVCPACHVACSLGDFSDCDGCKSLGRLGDVHWKRATDAAWRTTGHVNASGFLVTDDAHWAQA